MHCNFTVGSTHPSFSDVFLILPTYINRLTGLKTTPERVIDLCTKTVQEFLSGNVQRMKNAAKTEGQAGEKRNGDFVYHNLS
jgi:platelet-activating factor acetylhydrolase